MILRTFPSTKTLGLLGLCTLVCLTLALNTAAAAEEKIVTDTVETPSALIKWDTSAQTMTNVEATQAALLMEQIRQQLEERFIATGRVSPAGEMKVETTASGLKKIKATVDMMSFAVVRVGDEGQLVQACAGDPEAARETIEAPAKGEQ